MGVNELLKAYTDHAAAGILTDELQSVKQARVRLTGLAGSAGAFVAAGVYPAVSSLQVFVLPEREEAAYFLNDLENLIGEKHVFFFPASSKKPWVPAELSNPAIQQRAEALNRINRGGRMAVVTYPEALWEKVVTRQSLVQNTVEVKAGEKLSIEFLTEFFGQYDFELTDFVVEAGQYSVRGGIVDVFSYANELPYRIEIYDDKVESVRTFNPVDQLSVDKLTQVTILPNVQTHLLKETKGSFFEFIPADAAFWLRDVTSWGEPAEDAGDFYDDPVKMKEYLDRFPVIEFGKRCWMEGGKEIRFRMSPQPSFNKNFDLLLDNLCKLTGEGYTNVILADTPRQAERIHAILEDLPKKSGHPEKKPSFLPIRLTVHEGFVDHDLKVACYTDHQLFNRYHRYRLRPSYSRNQAITLRELYALKPGDYVTHIDHGIGRYAGLEKAEVNGKQQETIRLVYRDNDILYVSIHSLHRIAKYSGKEGSVPQLNKLGTNAWANLKQKTKKRVKDIARDLIALYAKRKMQKGFAFHPDTYLQNELEASFIYEDTPDQVKATRDVKRDMERPYPMDRLICGDVGFGKTEIAIRAAFKAVADGKQVAVLVPTTILALQHYNSFKERLKDFPCNIDYISRFKSAAEQKKTIQKLADGKTDIIIGTHRLLGKEIKFRDLGLLVIDEEQKFGVAAKEKLRAMRVNVDTLTLTATPIPRTLQFSLMGARDLSIINTPPPNRYPVTTELHTFDDKLIRDAINYEVERGGQVFFVHNRVQDINDMAVVLQKLCPNVRIGVGHGQMDGDKLEDVMIGFITGEYDMLLSTTIIESGLDIPNANTMIINQAQHFGLSDLHQLRGRVGRSNRKAFCYLLAPPASVLTPEARQRLKALEEFSELGSGFNISMRDLDIRGAGNMLGGEQSGFITEIGFEMYHKILDEAINELKETDFKELFAEEEKEKEHAPKSFVKECQIDTDIQALIPDHYVQNITERLSQYRDLDEIGDEITLQKFAADMVDRFGPLPGEVKELFDALRLRWIARDLGFEKIIIRSGRLICYFISNKESAFYASGVFRKILSYVQAHSRLCRMKEDKGKLSLTFTGVDSLAVANGLLKEMMKAEEAGEVYKK